MTSANGRLTTRATIVSGPPRNGHGDTDTVDTALALDLLRSALGAEVIATEPRPSPDPAADITEVWTSADQGPCSLCGTRTCRYGDRGSPLCADCRHPESAAAAELVPVPVWEMS